MDEQERLGLAQEIANALISQTKELKEQSIERSRYRSIARETVQLVEEQVLFEKESLATQEGLDAVLKKQAQNKDLIKKTEAQITALGKPKNQQEADLLENLGNQLKTQKEISEELKEQVKTGEKVQQNFGVKVMGSLEDITKKIPGLSKFSKPFSEASKAAGKAALNGGGALKALQAGGASLMGSVAKFVKTNPLLLIVSAAIKFVQLMFQADKETAKLAKSLNISYNQALSLRREFANLSLSTSDVFVNVKGVSESFTAISEALGTGGSTIKGSKELLATFTSIRERSGMTNEQLMGIANLTIATGTNLEKNTGEFLAQAKATSLSNGVLLNTKTLMADISNVSAATTLSLGKNPKAIAEAVAASKALGFELNRIESIQSSLLDFESSIAAELEAEVLLGKDINLNKAREAALNNDLATVAEEIAKQAGTSAEFAKMNFIQQEAIAKAVGMNREDLAKTLFTQEKLKGFTKEEAAERQKILDSRIKEVGIDQAMSEFSEEEFQRLKDQYATQEAFNKLMEKLQTIIVANEEGIMAFVRGLTTAVDLVGGFFSFFQTDPISPPTPPTTPSTNINDGVITPTNGLVVSSGAGSINLASNDSIVGNKNGIIAGTNLFDISPLVTEMQQMRAIMVQILSKDTNVYLDADKVGTSFNINTVSIQ